MNIESFIIEEYRAMQAAITRHQAGYATLESLAFGGGVVAYGFLLGPSSSTTPKDIPWFAWWAIPGLLVICGTRCWGHYLIVRRLAGYIKLIEKVLCRPQSSPRLRALSPGQGNFWPDTQPPGQRSVLVCLGRRGQSDRSKRNEVLAVLVKTQTDLQDDFLRRW